MASFVALMASGWLLVDAMSRTKGKVVGGSCKPSAGRYRCAVELVPDGEIVSAASSAAIPGGSWVELQVWKPPLSIRRIYTIVDPK